MSNAESNDVCDAVLEAAKNKEGEGSRPAEIPYSVLKKVMTRIVNEVDHVNRVFYDITSKPPGTIEFE